MLALRSNTQSPYVELRDVADPVPATNEAVIDVKATSLNRGEVKALTLIPPDSAIGWDLAGVVRQAAADGSGPAAGTRVAGLVPAGAWAQQVAVRTDLVVPLPDSVSFTQASALPMAGLTALCAVEMAGFAVGKRVLVTGASGGVGRFAVQLANLGGAHVTAVSSSPERAKGLAELGANEVIDRLTEEGPSFDVVLDGVGGHSMGAAMQRIADYGTIVVFASSDERPVTFPAGSFRSHPGASVRSLRIFDELNRTLDTRRDLARLVALLDSGRLDPQVTLEGSWREPEPVLSALLDRKVAGKAVLHVD